jgi:pimeloyl-ACP methyl ester carboxylesterase
MPEPYLHIESRGHGPVVALAHGFGGSARNFRGQARSLSDAWRVVTWDARGHARSDAPRDPEAYTLAALAGDVGRVLDAQGGVAEPSVVGGLSLGAAAALAFALATPDRVRGLVVASYPASRRTAQHGGFARVANDFANAIEDEGLEAAGRRFVWGAESGLDAHGAAFVRQGFLEHPPHALALTLRGVLAVLPEPEEIAARLSGLDVPTLLVAGGADAGSLESTRALEAALPNARRIVLPEAGHVVNLAAPAAFDAALREFLESL